MKGILDVTDDPVVSMDMKGNEHSSIIDGLSTNVVAGDLVKVVSWYDNEWGYACRLADLTAMVAAKGLVAAGEDAKGLRTPGPPTSTDRPRRRSHLRP